MTRAALGLAIVVLPMMAMACSGGSGTTAAAGDPRAPAPTFAPTTDPPPTFAPTTTTRATSSPATPTTTVAPVTTATTGPSASGAAGVHDLIARLVIAPERVGGYDRDLFGGAWVDADADGCDTRCEVLARERRGDLPGLPDGGWLSVYDGYSTPDPSELDIDHVVPLAEAWRSGAGDWDGTRRIAFANDLDHAGALAAVTASSNRAKSDRDPATWQPSALDSWCGYVTDWVETKLRWSLTADEAEARALSNMATARGC